MCNVIIVFVVVVHYYDMILCNHFGIILVFFPPSFCLTEVVPKMLSKRSLDLLIVINRWSFVNNVDLNISFAQKKNKEKQTDKNKSQKAFFMWHKVQI